MRRKLTLPVEPPVAIITAFLAWILSFVPLLSTAMPTHAAGRRRFAVDRRHLVLEQNLHAGFLGRGLERAHQAVARRQHLLDHRIGRHAGLHHRPIHDRAVHFPRHRIADRGSAEIVGCLVDEDDPVRDKPFERGRTVVGESADDFAIVVAVVGKAVRLDHRPIGQIAEQQVRGIVDAVFLLHAGAAAERHIAAARDGVAADILLGLDENDRGSSFARHNGGRQARCARTDDHDVCRVLPFGRRSRSLRGCGVG